ncbi:hypothetical protein FRAHR75_560039 [Frankia sp. Hr75.2]|nr:hypothetical protein FRAHR75_560039 [Frankia sp. Hr75.2]SQD99259.1 hypothetical protein FMEAI12_5170008 [Parafrankia sp. Ea1.12]
MARPDSGEKRALWIAVEGFPPLPMDFPGNVHRLRNPLTHSPSQYYRDPP